jgi:hypothetical protein
MGWLNSGGEWSEEDDKCYRSSSGECKEGIERETREGRGEYNVVAAE